MMPVHLFPISRAGWGRPDQAVCIDIHLSPLQIIDFYNIRRIRMPLINLVIVLLVVGVLLWVVNTYLPMDRKIKNILNIVVVIVVVIWLLQVFGVLGSLDSIRIG
jgi:hypothetical protein